MTETLTTATAENSNKVKAEKLAHYATKEPMRFRQYDGFRNMWGDACLPHDDDGDTLMSGCEATIELMSGGADVRVLIPAATTQADAVRLLEKLVGTVKGDSPEDWIQKGVHKSLSTSPTPEPVDGREVCPSCQAAMGDVPEEGREPSGLGKFIADLQDKDLDFGAIRMRSVTATAECGEGVEPKQEPYRLEIGDCPACGAGPGTFHVGDCNMRASTEENVWTGFIPGVLELIELRPLLLTLEGMECSTGEWPDFCLWADLGKPHTPVATAIKTAAQRFAESPEYNGTDKARVLREIVIGLMPKDRLEGVAIAEPEKPSGIDASGTPY